MKMIALVIIGGALGYLMARSLIRHNKQEVAVISIAITAAVAAMIWL
jgi:uncharacterized membrane protein YsdA (DUF1294 family)